MVQAALKSSLRLEYVDKKALLLFNSLLKSKPTDFFHEMTHIPHKIRGFFAGNRGGKTHSAAKEYWLRINGMHPLEERNRLAKHIRILAAVRPLTDEEDESRCAPYIELKELIPPELIIKDVTNRSSVMSVRSPTHGICYFEFVSWKQDLQTLASVNRDSLWADEEPPLPYLEESKRRLIGTDGDLIITLTPKSGISYLYDDMWQVKSRLYKSDKIIAALGGQQLEEFPAGNPNIACIQIATDDNPILTEAQIEQNFAGEDEDTVMTSRYGVFKAATGMIHKSYNHAVHFIDYNTYFPDGVPFTGIHGRGIDYHNSRVPWSIGWLWASEDDEWFLWQEDHPAIDGAFAFTTEEICKRIARKSGAYYYTVDLIDPLAAAKQPNSGTTVIQDINRHLLALRQNHGIGTAGYFKSWDTKTEKGRDEVRKRLKNAAKVGKPFNNRSLVHGELKVLPTLWVCSTCPRFDKSIRNWRFAEHIGVATKARNDLNQKPIEKFSHDNMVLEAFGKDKRMKRFSRPDLNLIGFQKGSVTGRGSKPLYEKPERRRYGFRIL